MEKNFKRTLITTALPYANGPVHIGHLAGVYVPADIYARYLRLKGQEVVMVGGSDEHGVPITIKAREEGVTPQDIVDRYHAIIRDSMKELGITFDVYSRTTSDIHARTASEFFRRLYDNGCFEVQTSMQPYDAEAGEFLADRYVGGTCPHCGKQAYGDQCEACGTSLSATELIDPYSRLTSAPVSWRETTHWYLPLNKYEERLRHWILDEHPEWKPNVAGQCKSWLDMGLQPRAVSRDLKWGVPVPVEGAEGKVLYVWFDAPIGYISNTKEILPDSWEKWWKDPDTRIINFIGKDNIVFHCIVFPAMLMAYGDGFQLPDNVPANEFLNLEGDKISTSRNWAIWLHEYLREFPGKQDVLRYVLTANAPETKDNDFTWADFQARNNNELVAILGNFVNRAAVLTHKYFGGMVPAAGGPNDTDRAMMEEIRQTRRRLDEALDTFHFREALKEAMEIARIGNRYLQETEPWKTAKTDEQRTATVLNLALQICANLAVAFEPFLPFASASIASMLRLDRLSWDMIGTFDLVPAGIEIATPQLLFEKIDDSVIAAQLKKLDDIKRANQLKGFKAEPQAPDVDFDTFMKADIRVGTVKECVKVPKADKLLRFTIDDGLGGRTIVSGIAKHYAPEDLMGKQVCFIANLPPRKLKGIESQGMILSAENADGSLVVIGPTGPVVAGAQVK
ncbi:methionine--tRNA ligase [Paramuribaculum intestinale]|uniref:methionine--tRNA ligase n=1 Tax=Paramuribaculum intestinale TaxID=2094151 RepID=UPI0025AA22F7|nr:methionine--tRNA ligase [Paramuribaculum intestinale]